LESRIRSEKGAQVTDLIDMVRQAVTQSAAEFTAVHSCPVLLLYIEDSGTHSGWSFRTDTISGRRLTDGTSATLTLADASNYMAFEVRKTSNSPWPERLTLGRARNNDIVLSDRSVSKLHAYIMKMESNWGIQDAGSRNGTKLNNIKLAQDEMKKLQSGDTIKVGAVTLTYVEPEALHSLLRSRFTESQ
jgi:hypothetical protein